MSEDVRKKFDNWSNEQLKNSDIVSTINSIIKAFFKIVFIFQRFFSALLSGTFSIQYTQLKRFVIAVFVYRSNEKKFITILHLGNNNEGERFDFTEHIKINSRVL